MKRYVLVLGLAGLLVSHVEAGDTVKDEIANLQGTWVIEKRLTNKEKGQDALGEIAKITFKGNKVILHSKLVKDGEKKPDEQFTFSIDSAKNPKRMDIHLPKEPGKDPIAMNAIYLLDGDMLKLAFNNVNRETVFPFGYPTDFEGKDRSTTTILKREKGKAGKTDADLIQGVWGAEVYVENGVGEGKKGNPDESLVRWTFKGDKLSLLASDVDEKSFNGSFKLEPTKTPKTIDITFPPAPGKKTPQRFVGIYHLEADVLKVCFAIEGGKVDVKAAVRPVEFKSTVGSNHVFVIFKKLKK